PGALHPLPRARPVGRPAAAGLRSPDFVSSAPSLHILPLLRQQTAKHLEQFPLRECCRQFAPGPSFWEPAGQLECRLGRGRLRPSLGLRLPPESGAVMNRPITSLGATVLAASLLAVTPVAAQSMQGQQQMQNPAPTTQPGMSGGQVSEEKLDSFAAAAVEIQTINEEARAKLSQPGTSESPEDLQRQANDDTTSAVEDEGLTIEEHNGSARLEQNDPELHSRVIAKIQEQNL